MKAILEADKKTCRAFILNNAAQPTMFGSIGSFMIIRDKTSVDALYDLITDGARGLSDEDLEQAIMKNMRRIIASGLFIAILATGNIPAVKKLSEIMTRYGEGFDEPKKNADGEVSSIIEDCSLSRSVKADLENFVGSNYEMLLPVIKSLQSLSVSEQKAMSFEDVMIRMPNTPGQIMPWAIFNGANKRPGLDELAIASRTSEAVQLLQRVIVGKTHPMIYSYWFVKSVRLAAMMIILEQLGCHEDDAAHALGYGAPQYTKSRPDPVNGLGGWDVKKLRPYIRKGVRSLRRNDLLWLLIELARDDAAIHGAHNGYSLDEYYLADGVKHNKSTIMYDMVMKTSLIFQGVHSSQLRLTLKDA
jgi:hypothetical protein